MSDDQRNVDASGVTAISQSDDCNDTKSAAAGRFPHGFYLGVATSPYQIEGVADEVGKRQPFWDTYVQTSGEIQNGSTGNVAEHPARFKATPTGGRDRQAQWSWARGEGKGAMGLYTTNAFGRLKRELPRAAPRFLERLYPGVLWYGDPALRHVALSYDDGPDRRDTPRLLDVLARHNAVATFSWLGERASAHPDLVTEVAQAGHHIMLHGQRHRSFLLEQPHLLRQSLHQARLNIAAAAGRPLETMVYVRPPFGHISPRIVRALRRWGYRPVMGSVVPAHWLQPASFTIRQLGTHIENGSLIVLHESLGGPPVDALTDEILKHVVDRGLSLISIDQLWAERESLRRPSFVSA